MANATILKTERWEQRYRDIATHLLARYAESFPNYVWTDEETAIDLMAAEIKTLRHEAGTVSEVLEALKVCQVRIFMLDGSENAAYRQADIALDKAIGTKRETARAAAEAKGTV